VSSEPTRRDCDLHGVIIRVDAANGAPPYLMHWRDGHESVFFPASGAKLEHHAAQAAG
jgi:Domain of unknown function (DUF1918)